MQKKKNENKSKRNITVLIICVVVAVVVWFLVNPLVQFNQSKNKMLEGAENYMERNSVMLPKEGEVRTIELSTLYSQKYVDTLYVPYSRDLCSVKDSWVKVTNVNGEYNYYPYLKCGVFETKSVDHEGPVVTLNGKEEITINAGDKYQDAGVKSVNDNEDGAIDISKVKTKNNVKSSKPGEYKVTYTISDSLGNETVKVRKVNVVKKLNTLVKTDTNNTGVYKGNNVDNYIMFSGMLFRIVKVNDDDTVKIVSDSTISYIDYNNVDSWLNDYFYNHLSENSKKYIVKGKFCSDKVGSNPDKVTKCDNYKDANVGLLSVDEYNDSASGKNSYLYDSAVIWTGSAKDSKKAWAIQSSYSSYSNGDSNAIRPVVNLIKDVEVKGGNGTVDNPYKIGDYSSKKKNTKVNKLTTGEYISYGGFVWRFIEKNGNGSSKIIMNSVLRNNDQSVSMSYEKAQNRRYNPKENENLGYRINQRLGDYIKTTDFVNFEIDVPLYKNKASYGKADETKKYSVKLAAPKMSEMFSGSNDGKSYWFRDSSKNKTRVYMASNNGSVYNTEKLEIVETEVKLVASLKKNMIVIDGKGTKNNPYTITK